MFVILPLLYLKKIKEVLWGKKIFLQLHQVCRQAKRIGLGWTVWWA
jgi:hypothetical protein